MHLRAYENHENVSSLLEVDGRQFPTVQEIFADPNPVEVEIGCGKGKFLIARAVEHTERNFLGIDVVWKWMKFAVQRSDKRGLTNIRFIKRDVRDVVRFALPPESVSLFHIYFPDPWPKRRHRKRRLITGDFLRLLHDRLIVGGRIEAATDHEEYFAQMRSAVIQSGVTWATVEERADDRLFEAYAKTNYETKYEAAGRVLHYLELKKGK